MIKIEKIGKDKDENLLCLTNGGILKKGSKVQLDTNYAGELNTFYLIANKIYTVEDVFVSDYGEVTLILEGHPEEIVYCDYLKIEPRNFNVYKWNGYYILANSEEQAQRIWTSSGLSSKNGIEFELFPKQITRIKAESTWPCIVEDLDYEKVLFESKEL